MENNLIWLYANNPEYHYKNEQFFLISPPDSFSLTVFYFSLFHSLDSFFQAEELLRVQGLYSLSSFLFSPLIVKEKHLGMFETVHLRV